MGQHGNKRGHSLRERRFAFEVTRSEIEVNGTFGIGVEIKTKDGIITKST